MARKIQKVFVCKFTEIEIQTKNSTETDLNGVSDKSKNVEMKKSEKLNVQKKKKRGRRRSSHKKKVCDNKEFAAPKDEMTSVKEKDLDVQKCRSNFENKNFSTESANAKNENGLEDSKSFV
ncbi:hypothetical protein MHBO_002076 [Bonamia ostreae]|uniref:Uncharacterized protein n=1 Tax=Bonamia ostreae TaxID=126728 RepID=A0ABV2AL63_9EUKA